ncbi:hypothetical protein PENCOP_c013G05370 [Penicillium coprophilum]|uniref:Uncharacterized protein n=1 Tax=Penicillium coprophilum TaxID=36646 RepID=A0A1V6UAM9_9EURO|nr:hypothetical protein PENCOP_c013G05370 [Penicillium coprophilum]
MATNYTELCLDPKHVFQSFENLGNCSNGAEGSFSVNFNDLVETCLKDYCKSPYPDLGGCGKLGGGENFGFKVSTMKGNQSFGSSACLEVRDGVNTDIGGPGVFVSYLMQLAMVFYFWIVLRSFHIFSLLISFCTGGEQSHEKTPPTKRSKRKIIPKIRRFFNQHDRITKVILVEFQEAQCFFMIASQAAILLAKKSTTIFEAHTMPSLWANNGMAGIVSSAGLLPVVMGMWSLQKLHLTEAWVFFLSVTTIVVSEFALYWMHKIPSPDQLKTFDYNGWPKSCGGYAPPLIYCHLDKNQDALKLARMLIWGVLNPYCLTVLGLDVILWLRLYVMKMMNVEAFCQRTCTRLGARNFPYKVRQLLASRWGQWLKKLPIMLTFCVELLFLAAVSLECFCFYQFKHSEVVDFSDWGFGQIVAMTIWLPVASKYAYLVLFGTEAYLKARMPESSHTDEKEDTTNKITDDVEYAALRVSDVIEHRRQDTYKAGQ